MSTAARLPERESAGIPNGPQADSSTVYFNYQWAPTSRHQVTSGQPVLATKSCTTNFVLSSVVLGSAPKTRGVLTIEGLSDTAAARFRVIFRCPAQRVAVRRLMRPTCLATRASVFPLGVDRNPLLSPNRLSAAGRPSTAIHVPKPLIRQERKNINLIS